MNKENLLLTAWSASFIATLGSLYFSEVMKYEPCELCWYQRIFMYPLVLILGAAIIKKEETAARYSLILSAVGGCISLYHYAIQKVDALASTSPACGRIPCTGIYINWFGFITIPLLALMAFIIIFMASLTVMKRKENT